MSQYPQADKVDAHREEMRAIGAFLEWLSEQGYTICKWQEEHRAGGHPTVVIEVPEEIGKREGYYDRMDALDAKYGWWELVDPTHIRINNPDYEWAPEGFYPARVGSIENWLALHFEIDQDAYEQEKRAMLAELQAKQRTVVERIAEETDAAD